MNDRQQDDGVSAAHDTPIEIDGDTFWVRRDFDLIKRVEQAFGPLSELSEQLRAARITAADLERLLRIVLAQHAGSVDTEMIRRHIFDAGIREVCEGLALLVSHMFAGNKRAVAWLEEEARRERGIEDENPTTAA